MLGLRAGGWCYRWNSAQAPAPATSAEPEHATPATSLQQSAISELRPERLSSKDSAAVQALASIPAKSWHNTAPTTLMESPQISSCRNNVRASAGSDTAATHSAPNVDNGDTSTMAAPTLMLSATASGS